MIVSWFSCGDASAVATKIALAKYGDVTVARCVVPEEHPDNDRFAADCARWFGTPILALASTEYASCEDVSTRRRYMAGPGGAVCTVEMKKAVRHQFERQHSPTAQVFGYTSEERDRAERFRALNPEVRLLTPLIDAGLSKQDCHAIVARAGLQIPAMYRLGFNNANCIGCVQAQAPSYWNRVRRHFPEVFERRATLSRELGVMLVKGTSGERERLYLDQLVDDGADDRDPAMDCSLLCWLAEQDLAA